VKNKRKRELFKKKLHHCGEDFALSLDMHCFYYRIKKVNILEIVHEILMFLQSSLEAMV
jgi:hypothetical protein